jgi:hypothetical protein
MINRPLVINDDVLRCVDSVKSFAHKHPYTRADRRAVAKGLKASAAQVEGYCCLIPYGFMVSYSLEQIYGDQYSKTLTIEVTDPGVDVPESGVAPNHRAVEIIMSLFGFNRPLDQCRTRQISHPKRPGYYSLGIIEPPIGATENQLQWREPETDFQ